MDTFDIAVIGMAGRFPQAASIEEFWDLISGGREAVVEYSDEELLARGVEPEMLKNPAYVKSGTFMSDIESFDADFFDISMRDAEITDPQHRLFMECAWQAMEHGGYAPGTTDVRTGLYAGISDNTYQRYHLEPNMSELLNTVGAYRINTVNGKDFIATRTAYKLNLKGPAMSIQTACSTSLVAVHVACQSLLNMECDMALAGGVSIRLPQQKGYLYQEGMISSPDGHCRAFDAKAKGTIGGSGVGLVLLKRLEDALEDGDTIHAVLPGSAVNNDGSDKIGYTAPSVTGQADVISEALSVAELNPDEISYIEAHGTGTPLGDPIEMEALSKAFYSDEKRQEKCAVGSVKTNIGHADTAAGIAGLIKTILMQKHQKLAPSLHYESPNPQINFSESPFYVNNQLKDWKPLSGKRYAGVSSFGIGGTNAHVLVSEAPPQNTGSDSRQVHMFPLSAKTLEALHEAEQNLKEHLKAHPETSLPDVAYTLQRGRMDFAYRSYCVGKDVNEMIEALSASPTYQAGEKQAEVVFMFPGQGSQYLNMTQNLYAHEATFREEVDRCATLLMTYLGEDIRKILFNDHTDGNQKLKQTAYTQPALFVVEYALAKLWISWGIRPKAMLGHSIGEYVAACLAGVFSLEDALILVAERGRLIQALPAGAMLAVPMSEEKLLTCLPENLSLSVVNSEDQCIVGGSFEAIESFEKHLKEKGQGSTRLRTSHAFHSHMMEPALSAFARKLETVRMHAPTIPILSNYSCTWADAQEICQSDYWLKQLRHTVRFSTCLSTLFKSEADVLLEVGPGQTLSALAQSHPGYKDTLSLVHSLPKKKEVQNPAEIEQMMHALGQLWACNAKVDWEAFYAHEQRRRIPLPTYPFQRKRYWIDSPQERKQKDRQNPDNWLHQPIWKEKVLDKVEETEGAQSFLLFKDKEGIGNLLEKWLIGKGHRVISVVEENDYRRYHKNAYSINPSNKHDFERLVAELAEDHMPPNIIHCSAVNDGNPDQHLQIGKECYYSVLKLLQALGKKNLHENLNIWLLSKKLQKVVPEDVVIPEKALILGVVTTLEKEYATLRCCSIDLDMPKAQANLMDRLGREILSPIKDKLVAYRSGKRWVQSHQPVRWQPSEPVNRIQTKGVYLISGGLGGIGLSLAQYLAEHYQARLILFGRKALPAKETWSDYLNLHHDADPTAKKIKAIQTMEQHGAEVRVYVADLSDQSTMQKLIASAVEHYGQIHGVIHAAGVADGALIASRSTKLSEQVFVSKVNGTRLLDQLVEPYKPDFFLMCSSLSSVLGAGGQVAYCAANAYQDAYAHAKRHHAHTFYTTINWDTWQEVGMAVNAVRETLSPHYSLPEKQALEHHRFQFYQQEGNIRHYHSQLNNTQWELDSHRIFGKDSTVMPGTGYIAWAYDALTLYFDLKTDEKRYIHLEDLCFLQPLILHGEETRTLIVGVEETNEGFEFSIYSYNSAQQKEEHARGKVSLIPSLPSKSYDIKQLHERCALRTVEVLENIMDAESSQLNLTEKALLRYGKHWHNLRKVNYGDNEALACLDMPEEILDSLTNNSLHPGLLDMATGCYGLGEATKGPRTLPFMYDSIRVYNALTSTIYSHIKLRNAEEHIPVYDICIMDQMGQVLVEIEGYTFREHKEVGSELMQMKEDLSVDEKIRQKLAHGLLPDEGVKVFAQVLKHKHPQVWVSKQDMEAQFRQSDSLLKSNVPNQQSLSFTPRPKMDTLYVAPADPMEMQMAEAWQRFLGVEPIGIHDDFFDLGGDSLLAIQLSSYLRKELNLDLSTQSLLNTPRIADLCTLLKPDMQNQDTAKEEILIQIKEGKTPPLIMVHPVGGNVVHYRKFARYLDDDQGLYAIRARGLEGQSKLNESIEAMASDYLQEIRQLQPQGPYYIGGYSMGGTIAFEMAQQLQQQGEEVAQLVMIDSGWPGNIQSYQGDDTLQLMADMIELSEGVRMELSELELMEKEERWKWFVQKTEGDASAQSQKRTKDFMKVFRSNINALAGYKPTQWEGRTLFLRAMETYPAPINTEKEWTKYIPHTMELHHVPGNHVSMLNEDKNAQHVARIVQHNLQKAKERTIAVSPYDNK